MTALVRALILLCGVAATSGAQASRKMLAQFEGVYEYHGKTSLALVSGDTLLFAVIDDARYPLRALGNDRFLNGGGDTIPFRRAANGLVSGFTERGAFFARRTRVLDPTITAAVRAVPRRAGAYRYTTPANLNDGLRVGTLADAGYDMATVRRLVDRVVDRTYPDVHSILVYRSGKLVVEEYFYGYDRDRRHQMRSLTKSVVSALVGIAIDRRALVGDSVLATKHLPYEQYANPDPRKGRITLSDLLSMRSGLSCDDHSSGSPGNEQNVYTSGDWVKFVMDLPMASSPGTEGHYCSGNVMVAGRIVERATGKLLPEFAQENLFTPLGIRARDVRWNYTLDSSNAATFSQLYLRPRDMLKLGVLYQQQGNWRGRQVISKEWVARSTAKWSTVDETDYGYYWWRQWVNASTPSGPRRVDMVVATGNGGQKIYLVPSLDLTVVMTGGSFNASSPMMSIMGRELLPPLLAR